jgi:ankyrin repeat protein
MLLASVTNQMLNRVAVGFISMTTSRFVARAPPYTSSGSMARGCFASLILKRVFGGPLRNLVLHGIRSNFGRMLQLQPIPEFMRDLQRAAYRKSCRHFYHFYHSMDAEYAELCVLAQPNLAFNLALNPRAPTFSSHFSPSSLYNRCSDQEARQQSQQLSTIQLLLQYRANVNAKAKECGNTALMDAAFEGCESAVLLLLQHQADVNALEFVYDYNYDRDIGREEYPNKRGRSALMIAALQGHESIVRLLLKNQADVNAVDCFGSTTLSRAAAGGHLPIVRLLLQHRIQSSKEPRTRKDRQVFERFINASDHILSIHCGGEDWTALKKAAYNGHESTVRLLLEHRADVNATGRKGESALRKAAIQGHESTVRLLLEHRADVSAQSLVKYTYTRTVLHESIVLLLLEQRADVNAADENGDTALKVAANEGHESTVRLLLEHRADVNATGQYQQTSLMNAVSRGDESIVRLLIEHRADVNAVDMNQYAVLSTAVSNGQESIVRLLIEHRAHVNAADWSGEISLITAAKKGHESILRLLLDHQADVNAVDKKRNSAISFAAGRGDESIVRLLLEHRADVAGGNIAVMAASRSMHESIVLLLLEQRADVNAADENGDTALKVAANEGHESTVRLLLEHRADVNATGQYQQTSLMNAVSRGDESIVRLLIEHRADVNAADEFRETAFSRSVSSFFESPSGITSVLLEHRADVNAVDRDGKTLLMRASLGYGSGLARLLLEHGADVHAVCNYGMTALVVALLARNESIVGLLYEHQAEPRSQRDWQRIEYFLNLPNNCEKWKLFGTDNSYSHCFEFEGAFLLRHVIRHYDESAVRMLLMHRADVHAVDRDGKTALMEAILQQNVPIVRLLHEYQAQPRTRLDWEPMIHFVNTTQFGGRNLLGYAIHKGGESCIHVVTMLLEHRADVNASYEDSYSARMQQHQDQTTKNVCGSNALTEAASKGMECVVRVLLEHRADANAASKRLGDRGSTALMLAARLGHESTVRVLLEHRADANTADTDQRSALMLSAHNGHESTVRLLLEHRADVNSRVLGGIIWSACPPNLSLMLLLIENKADVNACFTTKIDQGVSGLMLAASRGLDSLAQLLVEQRADVNAATTGKGETALMCAASNNHESVVLLLLEHRADTYAADKTNETALKKAAAKGHEHIVRLLLEHSSSSSSSMPS